MISIVEFWLAETKCDSYCGNVTFSNKTLLNGQETENNNLIINYKHSKHRIFLELVKYKNPTCI